MKHVSFELAAALREKGYNVPTIGVIEHTNLERWDLCTQPQYHDYGGWTKTLYNKGQYRPCTLVPTYQEAAEWFREVHNIHIEITTFGEKKDYPKWTYWLVDLKTSNRVVLSMIELGKEYEDMLKFDSYYDAYNDAIKEALKLMI